MFSGKYWTGERYIAVAVVFTTENAKKKKKNPSINFEDSRQFRG